MQSKRQSTPKLVAIVGGFLMLAGIILLGIAVLAFLGYLNASILLERKHLLMFAIATVAIGLLDTFSAIIIARW